MNPGKEIRRIEMQRLIKAYLLFNGEATSNELALYLDRNFGYKTSLTTMNVKNLVTGNTPSWLNIEYIKTRPGKWRLK